MPALNQYEITAKRTRTCVCPIR